MNKPKLLIVVIGLLCVLNSASAQVVGIKTNLVADVTTTMNVALVFPGATKPTFPLPVTICSK